MMVSVMMRGDKNSQSLVHDGERIAYGGGLGNSIGDRRLEIGVCHEFHELARIFWLDGWLHRYQPSNYLRPPTSGHPASGQSLISNLQSLISAKLRLFSGQCYNPPGMNIRRWLLWVLAAGFIWLVVTRIDEIENLATTLSEGLWLWVLGAGLLQVVYFVVQARVYQTAYQLVEVSGPLWNLVAVLVGSMFVNAVAPTGGTAGVALYVDDAVQRGESGPRAAAGTLLALIGTYTGFGMLVLYSLFYLAYVTTVRTHEIIAALSLLVFTLTLSALLVLGAARPALLQRLLLRFQHVVNGLATRLKRSGPLDEDWALKISEEFTAAATAAQTNPSRLVVMMLWAMAAHLLQVLSLYALFLAFRQPVTVSVGLAGYAMGHLFAIMAPTPQGVGFVETIMPLTFIALGVPGAVATIVVLAFRGLTFWLPLLAGFILMQRLKSLGAEEERALTEQWSVRIVALLTALMGLVNIVSVVYPGLAQDLEEVTRYAPLQLRRGGQVGAILTGLALLLLAHGLWRRKRAAWLITLGVLLLSAISHTLSRSLWDYRTLLTLALGAWLLLLRAHFHARSDQPSVRFGLTVLSAAVLFNLAYATAGLLFLASRSGEVLELDTATGQALRFVFAFRPPAWLAQSDPGRFLIFSLFSINVLTVLYALYHLLRPVLLRRPASAEEQARARAVVALYGKSSLARRALQPGHSYFFTSGGSLTAFQLQGRVAVAYGDPVGPAPDVPQAIVAFTHYCQRNDWLPAFYQVAARNLPYYEEAGFNSLTIGREAVIDVSHNGQPGEDSERLQQTVARLLHQGYQAHFITPPHPQPLLNELRLINDEWLTVRHAMDKMFALSWFDEQYVQESPLLLVRTPSGFISAFATLIPWPEEDSVAVDLFRYRPQVAEGTMELLLLTLLRWARSQELETVHLGVSPASAGDERAVNTLADALFGSMDETYTTPELEELRAIFQPRWLPRYLVYPGTTTLPAVWNGVLRANAGIGAPWLFFKQYLRL